MHSNLVASSKILVAMATKMVATWRVAQSDEASLASAGGFPMSTTFIKDVTPEIFNSRGLRIVSVNIYDA